MTDTHRLSGTGTFGLLTTPKLTKSGVFITGKGSGAAAKLG